MKNFETEFKWDASAPYAFARMLGAMRKVADKQCVSAPDYLQIKDVYLDAPDGRLQKEKIALRVRNTNGTFEITYKTRTEVLNGKAIRREETLPLPNVKSLSGALHFLKEKKAWEGILLTDLLPLFSISNRRVVRLIKWQGSALELSFDTCVIRAADRQTKLKEIELELKRGPTEKLEEFAMQIMRLSGLPFSKKSKVKTATALLNGGEK